MIDKENPAVLIGLLILILVEIGIIMNSNATYFRRYADFVVTVLFLFAAYFVFQYFQIRQKIPIRICDKLINL